MHFTEILHEMESKTYLSRGRTMCGVHLYLAPKSEYIVEKPLSIVSTASFAGDFSLTQTWRFHMKLNFSLFFFLPNQQVFSSLGLV